MTDDELLRTFEDTSLPADAFHHAQHVRVAWIYIVRIGMPDSLRAFSESLRRFAAAKGTPQLYHETITWAYVLLIAERQSRAPHTTWADFAAANPDLLRWKPSALDAYYTPELLWSDVARRVFVFPDRVPL